MARDSSSSEPHRSETGRLAHLRFSTFIRRLWWVGVTYWTRPAMWGAVAVYAILVGIFLLGHVVDGSKTKLRSCYPQISFPSSAFRTKAQLDRVLERGDGGNVEFLKLNPILSDFWRTPDGQQAILSRRDPGFILATLKQLPNLQGLAWYWTSLWDTQLTPISHLRRLEYLSLAQTKFQPEQLQYLSNLKRLKVLDLSGCRFTGGLQHLTPLEGLHTLILSDFQNLNDAALADLRHLPQLRTLVLAPLTGQDPGRFVTDRGLESLKELPNLRTVYVRDSHPFVSIIQPLRTLLPHVTVRRMEYRQDRISTAFILFCASLLLSVLIAAHVFSQFSQASARLIPQFTVSHFGVPATVFTVGMVVHTILSLQVRATLWPAVTLSALSLGGPGVLFLAVFANYGALGRVHSVVRGGTGLALIIGLQSVVVSQERWVPWLDAYLIGDFPGITALLGAVCLAIAGASLWMCHRVALWAAEAGVIPPTTLLGFRLSTLQSSSGSGMIPTQEKGGKSFGLLARVVQGGYHGNRLWQRIRLWQAGSTFRAFHVVLMMMSVVGILLATDYWRYGRWSRTQTSPFDLSRFVFLGVVLLVTSVAAVIGSWRRRMLVLGFESVHPVTRETIRSDVFLAIAWDLMAMLPGLIVLGLLMLAAASSSEYNSFTWITTVLVSCAALGGVAYAVAVWCVLIRRTWPVVVVGSLIYVILIAACGVCGVWCVHEKASLDPIAVLAVAASFSLLSVLALRSAWRRWLQIELA